MQEATEIIAKLKEEAVVIIATTVATLVPTFVLGCILNKKITTYKDSIGYLQQEVQDIKEKIESLASDKETLTDGLSKLNNSIKSMGDKIDQNTKFVGDLQQEVQGLSGKIETCPKIIETEVSDEEGTEKENTQKEITKFDTQADNTAGNTAVHKDGEVGNDTTSSSMESSSNDSKEV